MGKLQNKVAIITGATSGIGEASAKIFVEEGAKVILLGLDKTKGNNLENELGKDNSKFIYHDVTDFEAWKNVVKTTEETFGNINILVNCAGIHILQTLEEFNVEDYKNVIDINQHGVIYGIVAVQESMKKTKNGSIVNISSMAGLKSTNGSIAYSASKFAVRGITKTSAIELASFNIRVNAVIPGMTKTPMLNMTEEAIDYALNIIPLGRLGTPNEIGNLVTFLASDDASFITGEDFVVDGGQLTKFI